ncbi:MAG TPA: hypothetical protein VGR73_22095 [Bryobacteraceae bacterium]|nr:hypothetical protein [Bryobacteraceae bacterium]
MTIDERLDRLTARHEALTETVEILVHTQKEFLDRQEAINEKQEAINEKNQVVMAEIMESINSLARIAQSHERRISDIEEGPA